MNKVLYFVLYKKWVQINGFEKLTFETQNFFFEMYKFLSISPQFISQMDFEVSLSRVQKSKTLFYGWNICYFHQNSSQNYHWIEIFEPVTHMRRFDWIINILITKFFEPISIVCIVQAVNSNTIIWKIDVWRTNHFFQI